MPEALWIFVIYGVLGLVFYGNYDNYEGMGKSLYFLVFPFHLVVLSILSALKSGVEEYANAWKTALAWIVMIAIFLFFVAKY